MRPLLAAPPLRALAAAAAARRSRGPSPKQRETERTWVWGEARNERGDTRTARLVTSNGYRLTVDGVLMAVRALLAGGPERGYFTPSQLLGARCVERLPGCSAIAVE
jgi:short subunit dehydrogenase-like uncharacterized protein